MPTRKKLKILDVVDGFIKRSRELDATLESISRELDSINEVIEQRNALNDQLAWINAQKIENQEFIDSLRDEFNEYSFAGNDEGVQDVHDRRKALLAEIDNLRLQEAEVKQELAGIFIDTVKIAELAATLSKGVTLPNHADLLKTLEEEFRTLRNEQDKKLKALRSEVPSRLADKATFDSRMKELDSSYRTSEEVARERNRIQAQREEERKRFNQHQPKSSDDIRRDKDHQLALANSTPVREVQQW